MKPSAFTVLHNDVLEGWWRRSNGARALYTESSLSPRSLEGISAASYLTLCDWNTSSTRLQREVWWYLYLCLCQRKMGTERENTVTIWAWRRASAFLLVIASCASPPCTSVFSPAMEKIPPHAYPRLSQRQPPHNYSRLFGSVMASDAFHYLFTKVKCSQHVICPKWPCSMALLLA